MWNKRYVFSVLTSSLILVGCGGGSSKPEPVTEVNKVPVYSDGLAERYQAVNGQTVSIDSANFTDANNDALTIRYFTVNSSAERSYLESNQFTCSVGIVSVGAQANDGKAITDSALSEVSCLLNQQQVASAIEQNLTQFNGLSVSAELGGFDQAQNVKWSIALDRDEDNAVDVVVGIAQDCQQSDYDGFNQSPVMSFAAAQNHSYDIYPHHVLCLGQYQNEADLLAQLQSQLDSAVIPDMLVMTSSVSGQKSRQSSVLHRVEIERFESGKISEFASLGGIRVLGADSANSQVSCIDGQLKLLEVSQPVADEPRLHQFTAKLDQIKALAVEHGGVHNDCEIKNSNAVVNSLAAVAAVEVDLTQVEPKTQVTFNKQTLVCSLLVDNVASGDLDGDGLNDVVTVWEKHVFWHKNLGEGQFSDVESVMTLNQPVKAIRLADVNLDGRLDMLIATTEQTFWLQNNELVTFSQHEVSVNQQALMLDMFDVNGDGRKDIVSVVKAGNLRHLRYYANNPDGFSPGVDLASFNDDVYDLVLGDINNDGLEDIIIASRQIHVIPGSKDAGVGSIKVIPTVNRNSYNLAVVDLANDGSNELLVMHTISFEQYNLNDDLELISRQVLREGYSEYSWGAHLFYGFDEFEVIQKAGVTDVFVYHHKRYVDTNVFEQSRWVEHIRFNQSGESDSNGAIGLLGTQMVPTHLDSSSYADMLMVDTETHNLKWVAIDDQGEAKYRAGMIGVSDAPALDAVAPGNVGGASDNGMMLGSVNHINNASTISTWANVDNQWQQLQLKLDIEAKSGQVENFFTDYDNDGDLDVIHRSTEVHQETFVYDSFDVYLNNGEQLVKHQGLSTRIDYLAYVGQPEIVDLDGNGAKDIVINAFNDLVVKYNQGDSYKQVMINDIGIDSWFAADLVGDSKLELVVHGGKQDSFIRVYGQTESGFEIIEADLAVVEGNQIDLYGQVQVIDADGDGDKDILFVEEIYNGPSDWKVHVAFNQGNGEFSTPTVLYQGQARFYKATQVDANGDGINELALFAHGSYEDNALLLFGKNVNGQMTKLVDFELNSLPTNLNYLKDQKGIFAVADFNLDGREGMLLTTDCKNQRVLGYDRQGNFGWLFAVNRLTAQSCDEHDKVEVVDVDSDGDKDVILFAEGRLQVLENQ